MIAITVDQQTSCGHRQKLSFTSGSDTPTNHLWKPTLAKKMVFINGNEFPLSGYGFPLHGHFEQKFEKLFSAEKLKQNFEKF